MSKFPWGDVIEVFSYDFDGRTLEITKYRDRDGSEPSYHCEELHTSYGTLDKTVIAWIAHKNLGLNQHALVDGIYKALS